jgi:biotin carboxyl carrier protein
MTSRVRVAPTPASALSTDRPTLVAPDDPGEVVVEGFGEGRVVVHGADGTDRWAQAGPARRLPDGRSVVEVVVDGWRFELEVEDDARATLRERATRAPDAAAAAGPFEVRAVIPGRVIEVSVAAGDQVEAGATLLVVEAMKMQNELRAPRPGRIERVAVGAGATIELGDLLAVIA